MNIDELTTLGSVIADRSRVRILNLLLKKNHICMSDLQHTLGITQTATSRHLGYLKESGIVDDDQQGRFSFYHVVYTKQHIVDLLLRHTKDESLKHDLTRFDRLRFQGDLIGVEAEAVSHAF
jgi:ArsR family transcriptional regulator